MVRTGRTQSRRNRSSTAASLSGSTIGSGTCGLVTFINNRLAGDEVDLTTLGELATLLIRAFVIASQKPHENGGVDKAGHMNFST